MNGPVFVVGTPKSSTTSLHEWLLSALGCGDLGLKEAGILLSSTRTERLGDGQTFVDSNPWAFYSREASLRERDFPTRLVVVSLREPIARAESMYGDQVRALRGAKAIAGVMSHRRGERATVVTSSDLVEQSEYWRYWPLWRVCAAAGRLVLFDPAGDVPRQLAALAARLGVEEWPRSLEQRNGATPAAVQPGKIVVRTLQRLLRRSAIAQRFFARHRLGLLRAVAVVGEWKVPSHRLFSGPEVDLTGELESAIALGSAEWRAFSAETAPYWLVTPPAWLR